MKTYQVEIEGTAPLLQNKIPDLTKSATKKGEKEDKPEMAESKLYKDEKGRICQPAMHIEEALIKQATGFKLQGRGKKTYKDSFKGSVFVTPTLIPHLNQKWDIHQSSVVIPSTRGKIMRYRPILNDWKLAFTIDVNDDRIPTDVIKGALDEAGRSGGLGDWRPRYGRFIVTKFKKK